MNEYEFQIQYEGAKTVYIRAKTEEEARSMIEQDPMCNGMAAFDIEEEATGYKLVNWLPLNKDKEK